MKKDGKRKGKQTELEEGGEEGGRRGRPFDYKRLGHNWIKINIHSGKMLHTVINSFHYHSVLIVMFSYGFDTR